MLMFSTMVAILTGLLQLLNWIPSAVQDGAFQRYTSIDELRAHLKISTVYMPAYYPRTVQWPPSLIAAQTRPYPAVVTEFVKNDDPGETILIITQTALPHPPLVERLRLTAVRESVRYEFKGRTALLEVGVCRKDEQCCRMTWNEENVGIALVMRSSPVELVRVAESMITRSREAGHPADPPGKEHGAPGTRN
jgi:hypothetical protein